MDFQLTEEQTLIQDMAKNFAATELAPHSAKWDEEKFLDRSVFAKAAELVAKESARMAEEKCENLVIIIDLCYFLRP